MTVVLFETGAGFCLFKLTDAGILKKGDSGKAIRDAFANPSKASNLVKLQAIHRFTSTVDAVEDIEALGEGKISKNLKNFLISEVQGGSKGKKSAVEEQLVVADPKLGEALLHLFTAE